MTTLTLTIVFIFVAGYVCIAAESFTKVNKAAVAPICLALCANAPARTNIHIISNMFLLPAPTENW